MRRVRTVVGARARLAGVGGSAGAGIKLFIYFKAKSYESFRYFVILILRVCTVVKCTNRISQAIVKEGEWRVFVD